MVTANTVLFWVYFFSLSRPGKCQNKLPCCDVTVSFSFFAEARVSWASPRRRLWFTFYSKCKSVSVLFLIVFPKWLCSFFFSFPFIWGGEVFSPFFFFFFNCLCEKKTPGGWDDEKLLIPSSVYLMHAVEGQTRKMWYWNIDLECMVTFYKGILNKTYLYILINSLVWWEICSFLTLSFPSHANV